MPKDNAPNQTLMEGAIKQINVVNQLLRNHIYPYAYLHILNFSIIEYILTCVNFFL